MLISTLTFLSVHWLFLSPSVLEVYQFARDAAVAEAWLVGQEQYFLNQDLGVSARFTDFSHFVDQNIVRGLGTVA